jgi:catechol 2,3-dioxygenase-like lactoylglutathione lyase family enzyme
MKLDSVVLATDDLAAVRAFYRDALGFRVGTFEKDGKTVPDESDTYVNFDCDGVLLGFDLGGAPQLATIVVKVDRLEPVLAELAAKGILPERTKPTFAVIRDPEGREVLLQV